MLVNLVLTAIVIVFGIVFAIISVANIGTFIPQFANNCEAMNQELALAGLTCDDMKSATVGMTAGVLIVSSLLNGYFWVCNYSFYKELKEGNENPA